MGSDLPDDLKRDAALGEHRAEHVSQRVRAAALLAHAGGHGAAIIDVSFSPEGVIVTVRLRRRRRVC